MNRLLALVLVLALTLSSLGAEFLVSYASSSTAKYQVGEDVTATLYDNGLLRLSGTGSTYDYAAVDGMRAPFYGQRADILSVEIDAGITSIGACLFYECENLTGALTLPSTVVSLGDFAFSGSSLERAPKLRHLSNRFTQAEIVVETQAASDVAAETPMDIPSEPPATTEDGDGNSLAESASQLEQSVSQPEQSVSQPQRTIETVTQQEIGEGVFFPGQVGVFDCTEQNKSFRMAAENAGYGKITGYTDAVFTDGYGVEKAISVPVTERGVFLPDFASTGLSRPDESHVQSRFLGWELEDGTVCGAHTFLGQNASRFTAAWEKQVRRLENQKISATATMPDGAKLAVFIAGTLPENAVASAEVVPVQTAQDILDAQLGADSGNTVLYALDIAILVDGVKYQPSQYGESVSVSVSDIQVDAPEEISVFHVVEDGATGSAVVESTPVASVSEAGVEFTADSFSVYMITAAGGRNVSFAQSPGYEIEYSVDGINFVKLKEEAVDCSSYTTIWFRATANPGFTLGAASAVNATLASETDQYKLSSIKSGCTVTIPVTGVSITSNNADGKAAIGAALTAQTAGLSGSQTYQWMRCDAADGSYTNIAGAVSASYTIAPEDEGKYLCVEVVDNGTEYTSAPVGPAGNLIVFDLAQGPVILGASYSGKNTAGGAVTGTHADSNLYIIRQSDSGTATANTVSFEGSELHFDVTLDGVNISSPSSLLIPAYLGNVKHVTLRLRGENQIHSLTYYTFDEDLLPVYDSNKHAPSTLKITSAQGDGEMDGMLTINTNTNRYTCIGGTGNQSSATGLIIAGGTITANQQNFSDAAIGGGSNGYADIAITGGRVTATINGTAAAIGGGSGSQVGGGATVKISGGIVTAINNGNGVPIGGGGIDESGSGSISMGGVDVAITGGTVTAIGPRGISGGEDTAVGTFSATSFSMTGGSCNGLVAGETASGSLKRTVITLTKNGAPLADAAVDALTLSGGSYGTSDLYTDRAGKLYLWLPDAVSVTSILIAGETYAGNVASGTEGDFSFGGPELVFDLSKGNVTIGPEGYAGYSASWTSGGPDVTGVHSSQNRYIIRQTDYAATPCANQVILSGNDLVCDLTLDGVNTTVLGSVYIPASVGNVKHVTLRLSGENHLGSLTYYTCNEDGYPTYNPSKHAASTLKITSALGDGETDGTLMINTEADRYACIGAEGTPSGMTGLTIAGGTIIANHISAGSDCAIGAGSNGYGEITITGGHITATNNGNAATIGGGGGSVSYGGGAKVIITGGTIHASNQGNGVAIGGGTTDAVKGNTANIEISGGYVTATSAAGNAIGGGNSAQAAGGDAQVVVSGGTISCGNIGGGLGATGYRDAAVTITGGSLDCSTSAVPTNGADPVYLTRVTLYNTDTVTPNLAVSSITAQNAAYYGTRDMKTDSAGRLYLWLPADAELTAADGGGTAYTGSVAAKAIGILKYNCSRNYYSVRFPYSDQLTFYSDKECSEAFSGLLTVQSGSSLEFWVQAKKYDASQYYSVAAYKSGTGHDMEAITLQSDSNASTGLYHYIFTVNSDSELWFVTNKAGERPVTTMDLSSGNAIIELGSDQGTYPGGFKVTVGGYVVDNFVGDFLLTSSGLPTSYTLTVKSGSPKVQIDQLVASTAGTVIDVEGGTLSLTTSSFNDSITSTGSSPIVVHAGGTLNLNASNSGESLRIISSAPGCPAIGGAGAVNIDRTGGILMLTPGSGAKQIIAGSFTYTTSALSGEALPYSLALAEGTLAGYSSNYSGTTQLYAPDTAHTCAAGTTFISCGVRYVLSAGMPTPSSSVLNGALDISLDGSITDCTVSRGGTALVKDTDYTLQDHTLTITAGAAHGNLLVTTTNGQIAYTQGDYSAAYTGEPHVFHTIAVTVPATGATIQYSTDNGATFSPDAPTLTDVGVQTVTWKITAAGYPDVTGSNTFAVTKGVNRWIIALTCPSIQQGQSPNPSAVSKWGNDAVQYTYCDTKDGTYGKTQPTAPGTYYVRATVAATDNYDELISEPVRFCIESTAIYTKQGRVLEKLSGLSGATISPTLSSVPANGAFTILYNFSYIPDIANHPLTMAFSRSLPKGTKLTVLDVCDSHHNVPRYFYSIVGAGGLNSIASTSFLQMGAGTAGSYENDQSSVAQVVQYQLCVELPPDAADTSPLTITLQQGGADIPNSTVNISFASPASSDGDVIINGAAAGVETLTVPVTVSATGTGNKVLAFSLFDNNDTAKALANGVNIKLGDASPLLIRGNFAVFQLGTGDLSHQNYTLTMTGVAAGSYKIQADICIVADSEVNYPMQGSRGSDTTASALVVSAPPSYTFTVTQTGGERLVKAGDPLTFSLGYYAGGSTPAFGAQLYAKTGTGTSDYASTATPWKTDPTFSVSGSACTAVVTIPAGVTSGQTYRIVFTMTAGGESIRVPYNIIVE
ncbi:leucine-rich repeat protein [Zongyangia hominis]|uniref:Leucine-rich repeat protein n=1 Tax=Zongyangia hominis TaxID=2763677 RepID=A0A926EGF0_9FIRM|nr:leucine-rich repeat protein [Zongyangia hominis]MBC8571212.1 leucine-rich repeat protein [Zongyangia hominis]